MPPAEALRTFPFTGPSALEPPAECKRLREDEPVSRVVLPGGHTAWLVARYEDVRRVFSDSRFSREAITAPNAPRLLPLVTGSKSIFMMDPPEHTRLRKLVAKAFATRQVEQLRPRVEAITDGLLDAMAALGPPADLIAHLAQPLPIMLICELLGVPHQDHERFRVWTDRLLSVTAHTPEVISQAYADLDDYLTGLIAAKHDAPADDLLTALTVACEEGDQLSQGELLAFGQTLLLAGYHATSSEIIHAVLNLLRRPDQLRMLRAELELIPTAVEELLRYSQAGSGVGPIRIATEDMELGGTTIQAGEAVLPLISSANRDATVFGDPDRLDLGRAHNPHVAFGYGIHYCLGAHLGRVELQVALGSLLRRFPTLHLAVPQEQLTWIDGMAFRRPTILPVSW